MSHQHEGGVGWRSFRATSFDSFPLLSLCSAERFPRLSCHTRHLRHRRKMISIASLRSDTGPTRRGVFRISIGGPQPSRRHFSSCAWIPSAVLSGLSNRVPSRSYSDGTGPALKSRRYRVGIALAVQRLSDMFCVLCLCCKCFPPSEFGCRGLSLGALRSPPCLFSCV